MCACVRVRAGQALRHAVNHDTARLQALSGEVMDCVKPESGRFAVLSYETTDSNTILQSLDKRVRGGFVCLARAVVSLGVSVWL